MIGFQDTSRSVFGVRCGQRDSDPHSRLRRPKPYPFDDGREWGACWLGLHLWDLVGLDSFWTGRLPRSSHGTDWLAIFKAIVLYRLTSPGSEWRMHRDWYDVTAVRDLLGESSYTSKSNCRRGRSSTR